ncbi:class I SAM-dependent methyltransferase [Adlercreutzia sp. ZJ154]|uniref:class I SAM-dependent methyltransferase n=1 Tax=Adlercreutzia sp. ZJ154 TaxID=2709790 RepID=UPI0013EA01C5|nr:class I SAM-dependent methyltransferase [Adlercreutzia sp. ZJ154]
MHAEQHSLITAQDWNNAWKASWANRAEPHGSTYWNTRAKTFGGKDSPSSYTSQFLELAEILPEESVFDMGCGTGNLSVPLGTAGHNVLAADFSSVMLNRLNENLQKHDIACVKTTLLSWEDNWQDCGILPESYDVCVASRSIATSDLADSLAKLTTIAKRRVCVTLAHGASPRIDDKLLRDMGIEVPPNYDFVYAIAILKAQGFIPELRYIPTERRDYFTDKEEAVEKYSEMITTVVGNNSPKLPDALERLPKWLDQNLESQDDMFTLKHPRQVPWAFISWNKF